MFASPTCKRIWDISSLRNAYAFHQCEDGSLGLGSLRFPPTTGRAHLRGRVIGTFDSSRLLSSDCLNIAGVEKPNIRTTKGSFRLAYHKQNRKLLPFPSDSRGFLYLSNAHKPQSSWQIRFRVTNSDSIERFESGNDLLLPSQRPWAMTPRVLGKGKSTPMQELLLEDDLLRHALLPTRRRLKQTIQTLNHSRLRSSDYLNLAGIRNFTISTPNSNFNLTYSAIGPSPIPFPYSARGFLYLYAPAEEPQITWQIRFRVTDNDSPESFKFGSDLISLNQTPWYISLAAVQSPYDPLSAVRELLVHDGLDIEYLADKSIAGHGRMSQPMIYSLGGQMFHIELIRPELSLGVGHGEGSGQACRITSPFCIRTRLKQDDYLATTHHPYSGSALCCFEAHSSSTSTQPNTLALRIMKIVTPISINEPEFTYRIPMPQEGELAMRYTRSQKGVGTGLARTCDPQPWTLTTGISTHPIVQAILRGKTVPWTVR